MQPPWPGNRLKNLSRHIRDGTTPPENLPTYDEVMLWYNDLAAQVQQKISGLDWSPLLGSNSIEVSSRPKTIDTLRQKLLREPSTPLPSVQDIAGVRFDAEMSLAQQDAVAVAIAGMYGQGRECVKDLRATPHSGYRAVHVWLRLPARVEVQVRTHLQSAWANAYEAAADFMGRDIRYGQLPSNSTHRRMVKSMQTVSIEQITPTEQRRDAIEYELLRLQEDSAGAPLYRQQLQDMLEAELAQRREAERGIRDALQSIHDQFRSLKRSV